MPFLKFVWVFSFFVKNSCKRTPLTSSWEVTQWPHKISLLNLNHGKERQASVFFRQPCARILADEMDPKRSTKGPRVSWAYDLELLHHCSPGFKWFQHVNATAFCSHSLWLSELLVTLWLSHRRFLWQDIIPNHSFFMVFILEISPRQTRCTWTPRAQKLPMAIVLRLPSSYQSPSRLC